MGAEEFKTAYSFFIGVYGIAMLAVISVLILRDPIWRGGAATWLDATNGAKPVHLTSP